MRRSKRRKGSWYRGFKSSPYKGYGGKDGMGNLWKNGSRYLTKQRTKKAESPYHVIPTKYDGIKFRSKTEAHWAVVFNELKIKWEYEKEGAGDGREGYCPDFYFTDWGIWVEIKGKVPTIEEERKAQKFAVFKQEVVYILFGSVPRKVEYGCENERVFLPREMILNNEDFDSGLRMPLFLLHSMGSISLKQLEKAYDVARNFDFFNF